MSFVPGMLVACVRDDWTHTQNDTRPQKGRVYTVRDTLLSSGRFGLRLVEIVNPPRQHVDLFCETAWDAEHFRPLDETRLAVFGKALVPVTVRQFQPDLTPT